MNILNNAKHLASSFYYRVYDPESFSVGIIRKLPEELILTCFSYLNLKELLNISSVSRQWSKLSATPVLLKHIIYSDKAFTPKDWSTYFGYEADESEMKAAWDSFPFDIGEIFKTPTIFPNKKMGEIYIIVWIPKGFNLKMMLELLKNIDFISWNSEGILTEIIDKFGDEGTIESAWIAMQTKCNFNRSGLNISDYEESVQQLVYLNRECRLPSSLEAIISIASNFFKFGNKLFLKYEMFSFDDDHFIHFFESLPFIACHEKFRQCRTFVGLSSSDSIDSKTSLEVTLRSEFVGDCSVVPVLTL